ncbi:MAG: protease complex subunit PrcB family protein [Minisyncoccia bacterium]
MKDRNILIGTALVLVVFGVFAFLNVNFFKMPSSALTNNQLTATAVPFVPIVEGSNSKVTTRTNYLITSSDQLQKLWGLIDATGTPPPIDFSSQNVLAVFAGQEPTTGYAVAVSKVVDSNNRVVSVTIQQPDSACQPKAQPTAPYELVTVPATTLPLTHQDIPGTNDCQN